MSRKARLTVAPPHFDTTNRIEYSIHKCPKTLYKEVLRIFPDQTLPEEEILIVSIFQPSGSDLVVSGDPQTEQTKDDLLQKVRFPSIRKFSCTSTTNKVQRYYSLFSIFSYCTNVLMTNSSLFGVRRL